MPNAELIDGGGGVKAAAGIAFTAPDGRILFLKRAADSDHPGEWCFPGGGVEDGEDAKQAASREAMEEVGFAPTGPLSLATRRTAEGVDFTTFISRVDAAFEPKLNDEHIEFEWAMPGALPEPMHPGVAWTMADLAMDEALVAPTRTVLAFDRGSVRRYDHDGRMHVETANISKANVCPYLGREIPDWQALGLQPDRTYQLYRDPEELKKAVPSFNSLPILSKHVPVNAEDHQPDLVVGSTGTHAEFNGTYLRNALVFWAAKAIRDIEGETAKELSSAYRYRADMTPGSANGTPFDGVMRDIVGNHVALVRDGRAGKDVVVGDSKPLNPYRHKEITMAKALLSRKAAMIQGALTVLLTPKLAQDAKLDMNPILAGVTAENLKSKKKGIVEAIKGKLAQDADITDVIELLDTLDAMDPAEVIEEAVADPLLDDQTAKDDDNAALRDFLAGKLSPEDIEKVCQMAGAPVLSALDADDPKLKDMVTKPAMDAAINVAVRRATEEARRNQVEIRDAEKAVRPYVGDLAIAQDSAAGVYRTALTALGVKVDGVHESAFPAILAAQAVPSGKKPVVAMDAAAVKGFNERYPAASRIQTL